MRGNEIPGVSRFCHSSNAIIAPVKASIRFRDQSHYLKLHLNRLVTTALCVLIMNHVSHWRLTLPIRVMRLERFLTKLCCRSVAVGAGRRLLILGESVVLLRCVEPYPATTDQNPIPAQRINAAASRRRKVTHTRDLLRPLPQHAVRKPVSLPAFRRCKIEIVTAQMNSTERDTSSVPFGDGWSTKDRANLRGEDKLTRFAQNNTIATGDTMENSFCSVCGTLMYRRSSGYPGKSVMRIGTVDDHRLHATNLKPQIEQFAGNPVEWLTGGVGVEQKKGNFYTVGKISASQDYDNSTPMFQDRKSVPVN